MKGKMSRGIAVLRLEKALAAFCVCSAPNVNRKYLGKKVRLSETQFCQEYCFIVEFNIFFWKTKLTKAVLKDQSCRSALASETSWRLEI